MSQTHRNWITEEIVKPTCKSWHSVITQTYRTFKKKTATLKVVFMHNLSGKVQFSFLFMRNLPFSLKLFLFQKYFFSFFVSQAEPQAKGEKKPNHMLPEKWYIMFHTGEG